MCVDHVDLHIVLIDIHDSLTQCRQALAMFTAVRRTVCRASSPEIFTWVRTGIVTLHM